MNLNPKQQPDRVSYSFGMKLSLPTKYESADFHISLTSDVEAIESISAAFQRVRSQVVEEATKVYQQIRNSETGLINESLGAPEQPSIQSNNERDVETPAAKQPNPEGSKPDKPRDGKALRQQIKFAASILELQKKISKSDFKSTFLSGKKVDELTELEVTKAIIELREKYPELNV